MYALSNVKGVVRVEPELFDVNLKKAVTKQLELTYVGRVDNKLGKVIKIVDVKKIGEGTIVPGDGSAFYEVIFKAIHYKPKVHEIIEGKIRDIAKFGAFIDFGPFEGMVHISQTMDDYVSVSKDGSLQGKDSKKVLKIGDEVRARIVAVSIKNTKEPKIGLTMRQEYLGKTDWVKDWVEKEKKAEKKAKKESKK